VRVFAALWLAGCPGEGPPPLDGACLDASLRLGQQVCVHQIPDLAVWDDVSGPSESVDRVSETKWLAPAHDGTFLTEPLFLDVDAYPLHWMLLAEAFPDAFPGMDLTTYSQMVIDADHREYFSGELIEFTEAGGSTFGFTVWADPIRPAEAVTLDELRALYATLSERIGLRPLSWVPNGNLQRADAERWTDAGFPIRSLDDGVLYEPYSEGVAFGTVRLVELADLAELEAAAAFGHQDLLVLDEAPFDLARPVAGTITGTRQGTLSHLNVRAAARGTPNVFVRDAHAAFAPWADQLVRFEATSRGYSVALADPADAEAWWASIRPEAVVVPEPDLDAAPIASLRAVPTDTASERASAVRRYGSKGANLATLYQRIPEDRALDGFLVPFVHYAAFLDHTWTVDLGDGPAEHTFADTLDAWHDDPAFLNDAVLRGERLAALRDAMRAAPQDPELLAALRDAIRDTYGSDTVAVRFRSSSNAEDALDFSGAGLYESTTACLADELDDDTIGPSRCDPDEPDERTLTRALGKVWASLWLLPAWEERSWYGVDHGRVAMGILVDDRIKGERANIVAFTGNPTADDDRFLINAQVGELDVVSAAPGVFPERTLLTLEDGDVVRIERAAGSSELPPGDVVLDDATLRTLGAWLADIHDVYPVDAEVPADRDLLLDTEWKFTVDERLIVKQVRPFLR
jgi:pyruvate,water dikinase